MSDWCEKEISISEIQTLLNNHYEVEVDSPDGWVGVNFFIDKGKWDEYVLTTVNGLEVRCNEDHLFKTNMGWVRAKNMINPDSLWIVETNKGPSVANVIKTNNEIQIVDINVNHKNHRYYTNGVESHNTGVGKSLFMCHVAASCLNMGKNVLYITLELAEEEVAKRIDANLMNITFEDLMSLTKDMYDKKANSVKNKTNGKLIIKEYPTASASAIHFKALLNELYLKKTFRPDIIFIDYLNICSSARVKPGAQVNSYTYVKSIAEELRGLAVEYTVPVVSATQTTRSGYVSSDVGLEDTSESFGLPATADFMFALISTEDLEKLGQIMVKQLKNRYNDPSLNKRFVVGIDRSKMKLYDVEDTAQTEIIDSGQTFVNNVVKNKFKTLKV
jgi:KaiC/GvpD/RAD55 family RecA-like ATPase